METDKNSCWYQQTCVDEMNRFYDVNRINQEVCRHFFYFSQLLSHADEKGAELLDLGCGTALLSEYCKENHYRGADLPHIISGCAIRNYEKFDYRGCDIINDDLSWIDQYPVVVMNAVIDIMQHPLEMLSKVLSSASKYVIIHRQEITEAGETRCIQNDSYGGYTYHSIINRNDFNRLLEENNFDVVKELQLEFTNWENNGSSFLLRKRRSWSLYKIDHKLNAFLKDVKNGFFIEAGANDGLTQSNSYFFEFYKNWKGLLVEPIDDISKRCIQNRSPNTIVENYALVSDSYSDKEIDMIYTPICNGLMSIVDGKNAHLQLAKAQEKGIRKKVPVCTLNHLLKKHGIEKIDLLILDIEGHEIEALKGIDFEKHKPEYMLIEQLDGLGEIDTYLATWYDLIDQLTHHDYLYKRK